MNCDLCKKKNVKMMRFDKIIAWPHLLIVILLLKQIQLQRFTFRNGMLVKIHTKWKLEK